MKAKITNSNNGNSKHNYLMETISAQELIKSSQKPSGGRHHWPLLPALHWRETRASFPQSPLRPHGKGSTGAGNAVLPSRVHAQTRPSLHGASKIKFYFLQVRSVLHRDFSGGRVENQPCNAEDVGLIPQDTGQWSPPHNQRSPRAAMKTQHSPKQEKNKK